MDEGGREDRRLRVLPGFGRLAHGGGAPDVLRLIGRVVDAGGKVRFISMDEPFDHTVLYTGPSACHWSAAKTAREVAAFVKAIHAEFPAIKIGLVEPYTGPESVARIEGWIEAYEKAVGGPLPFFHLDVDWTRPDWLADTERLQSYVRGHGIRFGLYYTSWPPATSDAAWFAGAEANMLAYELDGAGPPDDAIFASWTDHPDYVLPETGPNTMTHLIADYIRTRTTLSLGAAAAAAGGGRLALSGRVETLGGAPVGGAAVEMTATPRDGPYQVLEFRGTVPAGVSEAVIQIWENEKGAIPGAADLTFYEVGYAEGASTANLVPNARFEWGWGRSDDASASVPSDHGTGMMLRVVATPIVANGDNSGSFAVTPGTVYRFWFAARIPEAWVGGAYIAPIFLKADWSEVRRDIHPLAPAPIALGTATTAATGAFSLTTDVLEFGRYRLRASYAGVDTNWPARTEVDAVVPLATCPEIAGGGAARPVRRRGRPPTAAGRTCA